MIVLDTNVVSELMRPSPDDHVRDWLGRIGNMPLATTAITIAELEFGLQRLPDGRRKADLKARFEMFAAALTALPLDEAAGRLAGRFRAEREAANLSSQPSDMMIAGIVAANDASLATRNTKDFQGLPIQLINPWRVF